MNNAQRFVLTNAAIALVVITAFLYAVHHTDTTRPSCGSCWSYDSYNYHMNPDIDMALMKDYIHTLQTDPALSR